MTSVSDRNLRKMLSALKVETGSIETEVAPRCFIPDELNSRPAWGISLQLYELRSVRNWGIGDFADLWTFCETAGELGADFIGLSPLHAPFTADAERCSPYEPSNRRYLNPVYIAVDEIGGFESTSELEQQLVALRDNPLVDYKAVMETKIDVLRNIWRNEARQSIAFEAFVAGGGRGLHMHALFEAVSHVMANLGQGAGWKSWPAEYMSPDSPHVKTFEEVHQDDILFQKWLQWLAHVQLGEAKERARKAGMRVGLYLDLAVGEALDGSATWSDRQIYVSGAAVGNPPEPFAADGQDWRLAALQPACIAGSSQSPFRKLLAASMQYAGAIRIDHAAAIARLFLVPTDGVPADGAYVSYPTEAMLRELAEVSAEHRCMVIGEDLGNVAEGLREDLANSDVLSYRILFYERNGEGFIQPAAYPKLALARVSTHDHQTFNGWWQGADVDMRLEHGLVPPGLTDTHRQERQVERDDLVKALRAANVLDETAANDESLEPQLALAAYRFIAQTRSMLVAVRLADLTDEKQPTNIPGTSGSYPNWKPKLSVPLDAIAVQPFVIELTAMMRKLRPGGEDKALDTGSDLHDGLGLSQPFR
jgi:4-alpha-glucanotransferase